MSQANIALRTGELYTLRHEGFISRSSGKNLWPLLTLQCVSP